MFSGNVALKRFISTMQSQNTSHLPTNSSEMILMASLISLVLISLLVSQRHQRYFIVLAARLIVRPNHLHTVRMLQVFILVLSSGAQLLDHVCDAGVDATEDHLFLLLHAYVCEVVYAFNSHSQFTVTKFLISRKVVG